MTGTLPKPRICGLAGIAQLVERVIRNDEVVGSIPISGTKNKSNVVQYGPESPVTARVSAFFVLLYTHTVPTNDFFSVPTKNRYALNSAFLTACR